MAIPQSRAWMGNNRSSRWEMGDLTPMTALLSHLPARPGVRPAPIYSQHHMVMVRHHRIGTQIYRKHLNQRRETFHHPLPAMLIILARVMIPPTQESPAYTTANTVVIRRFLKGNLLITRSCHGRLHADP